MAGGGKNLGREHKRTMAGGHLGLAALAVQHTVAATK